jgi:predicted nucleotidyltransferase
VVDEILLTEVAEEEGFDVTDQMEITKYLKLRVSHKALRLGLGSILFRSWN